MRAILFSKVCAVVIFVAFLMPVLAFAQSACPFDASVLCAGKKDGTAVACVPAPGHLASGYCKDQKFINTTATSLGGGSSSVDFGQQILQQIIGQLIGKLFQGSSGGESSGGTVQSTQTGTTQTNTGVSSTLLNNLNNSQNTTDAGSFFSGSFDFGTGKTTQTGTSTGSSATQIELIGGVSGGQSEGAVSGQNNQGVNIDVSSIGTTATQSQSGTVNTTETGGTIEGAVRNNQDNSEVAGFYGSGGSTFGSGGGFLSSVCASRPWAKGVAGYLLPDSFFDNLCLKNGYQPGVGVQSASVSTNTTQAEQQVRTAVTGVSTSTGKGITCTPSTVRPGNSVALAFSCGKAELTATAGFSVANKAVTAASVVAKESRAYGIACSDNTSYQCSVRVADPRAVIWADPATVSLGGRTTIFWNAQDVESCSVAGPSFSETGLYGGASTVGINTASTFTINCKGLDGEVISEKVIVDFSL